jgi:hypothetical protein
MAEESGFASTKLGTVTIRSDVAGRMLDLPVDLELSINTTAEGAKLRVVAEVGLANVQGGFDDIMKSVPMPNDTSGYGTKIVASVQSASLRAEGNTAVVDANVNVTVWQIEKGVPGGGTTIRWEEKCVDLPWPVGRVCTNVPTEITMPPGDDIKLQLLSEGVTGTVPLQLVTPDGISIEMRPGPATVTPRSDIGRFFNDVAGIFNSNLSARAQVEIADIVNDGKLRQALPTTIREFNPQIANVQFVTKTDGSLGVKVDFRAVITPLQLTTWMQQSMA